MQVIASYLMYLPILYITCLILLSNLSKREREVEHTVSIYKPHHLLNKEYTNKKKNIYAVKWKKNYMDITIIIILMKTCQSCVLTPAKSPFLVMIFFKFAQNPVGNLIFRITSLTTLLCCSVKIHGIEFILTCSLLVWNWMMSFIAWFLSWISLHTFTTLYFSLPSSSSRHKVSVTLFLICIVSNKWAICRCS